MKGNIYADAGASAGYLWPRAARALLDGARLGNPSSAHAEGRAARQRLREAREQVASVLGAEPAEVIFTSGATESLHLAVNGLLRPGESLALAPGLHAALSGLAHVGLHEVALSAVIGATAVCHETGAITDIAGVAEKYAPRRLIVDAAQAVLSLRELWAISKVTALALSGQKVGGPTGTGVLLLRRGTPFVSVLRGGPQEHELRAGTEPVALICAFAQALACAYEEREAIVARRARATQIFEASVLQISGARVYARESHREPGMTCASIIGIPGRLMASEASKRGVFLSAGPACAAQVSAPSAALLALGVSRERAREAFRVSFGFFVTEQEAARVAAVCQEVAATLRAGRVSL